MTYQIGILARAIELNATSCLLVLDEVDRLPHDTVELIQRLLDHGPSNLHLALTFRSNPGLDLAMRLLDGSGILVDVEDFRFSKSEIDQFFNGELSRRQLIEAEERTAGWPLALLVYRNERAGSRKPRRSRRTSSASACCAVCLRRTVPTSARWRSSTGSTRVWSTRCSERVTPACGSPRCGRSTACWLRAARTARCGVCTRWPRATVSIC